MATKSITIDIEAYRRLKSVKQAGESFSETIKRIVHKPIDFEEWMKSIEGDPMSDKAVNAVETVVAQRRDLRNRRRSLGAA